jgi:hypothetical protein
VNNKEIRKVEEAFKKCFQADSIELLPCPEWQRNLMINIRAVALPPLRKSAARQEIIIWRLAWTSLAASIVLAAVFSFSQFVSEDSSSDGSQWEDKVFAVKDMMRE